MKAAVYYSNRDVRIEDYPRPAIGDGELLVRVMASGICGSDVMEWYRKKKAPLVPGHEVSGEVEETGKGVSGFSKGDRVSVIHKVPCNTCVHCLKGNHPSCETTKNTNFWPGGFSEYIRVPKINVDRGTFLLPDSLSHEEGTFIEPLSCAVRAQRILGGCSGDTVLVLGSGVAGLLNVRLALATGASKVLATDVSDYRLKIAEESGAVPIKVGGDLARRVCELNGNCLADKVIVCTGARSAAMDSFGTVERGGSIMFFAVPRPGEDVSVPLNDFWTREIRLMASYYTSPADIGNAIRMLESGRIRVRDLITHRLPLEKAQEGFRMVSEAGNSLKVILQPHGG
jgi:L-iditol 2-dehydrogenase